jgi:hypothetical protein
MAFLFDGGHVEAPDSWGLSAIVGALDIDRSGC